MSDPLHTPTMLLKNSLNIQTPGEKTEVERSRPAVRRLLVAQRDSENDPPPGMMSPSKFAVVRQLTGAGRLRLPLEDHDPNSQDSGISEDSKSCSEFRFAEPCGAAPRRMASVDMSPHRFLTSPVRSPRCSGGGGAGTPGRHDAGRRCSRLVDASPKRCLSFSNDSAVSLSSFSSETTEDGFLDLFQSDSDKLLMDEDAQMAGSGSRLGNLLSARILTNSTPPRSPQTFHRSMSENISPNKNSGEVFSLKRPLLLSSSSSCGSDATTPVSKRHRPLATSQESNLLVHPTTERGTLFQYGFKRTPVVNNSGLLSPPKSITPPPQSPPHTPTSTCGHVHTSSDHSIKLAFQRSTTEELIGDYTRPFALPLLSARDHDLKTISTDTLADLLHGHYQHTVSSYKIVDCRYPYEYDGGHIRGAVNLYRRDQITHELQSRQQADGTTRASQPVVPTPADTPTLDKGATATETDRRILVFHCEYSAERGPNLLRYLREEDRTGNPYPQLTYPELYLLDGGYRAFYSRHPDLCDPSGYKPMSDPAHVHDLRHFRAKSKSWTGKHHKKLSVRNLSRLGF